MKIGNANTKLHQKWWSFSFTLKDIIAGWNSPPDCSYAGTIVALAAKIGNANTKASTEKSRLFFCISDLHTGWNSPPDCSSAGTIRWSTWENR